MPNLNWSEINIMDELIRMEVLLSTSLYMDNEDQTECDMATNLVGMVLQRITALKKASGVKRD